MNNRILERTIEKKLQDFQGDPLCTEEALQAPLLLALAVLKLVTALDKHEI